MFDDFSFATASRHPSSLVSTRKPSLRALCTPLYIDTPLSSPTSTPLTSSASKLASMDELSRQLSEHSLYSYDSRSSFYLDSEASRRSSLNTTGLLTPPNEPISFSPVMPSAMLLDEADCYDDSASTPHNACAALLRRSRQRAVRMQCTTAHLEEIALMVQRRDQCTIGYMTKATPTSDASWNGPVSRSQLLSLCTASDADDDDDRCMVDAASRSSRLLLKDGRSVASVGRPRHTTSARLDWHGSTSRGCVSKSRGGQTSGAKRR